MKKLIEKASKKMMRAAISVRTVLIDRRGESAVGQAVVILTAVVLGALLLGGLYALLKNTVLPGLADRIRDMFNYAG